MSKWLNVFYVITVDIYAFAVRSGEVVYTLVLHLIAVSAAVGHSGTEVD